MKNYMLLMGATLVFTAAHGTTDLVATNTSSDAQKFIMITTLYNELHPERLQEFITCLEHNLADTRLEEIHVFYDTAKDTDTNPLHDALKESRATLHYITGRASYDQCFQLGNQFPNRKIIICNADIYFNETLDLLNEYDFTNTFMVLSRWNITATGQLVLHPFAFSQDTWIYQAPIVPFEKTDIYLGTVGCDSTIAYHAQKAGLRVINPCLTIQTCHLHLSKIRNYSVINTYPKNERLYVTQTEL